MVTEALVRSWTRKANYRIDTEDNGPGIPDEIKGKLFRRLWRGKTRSGGRGLGLYLARALISDIDGRIWMEDRVPGDYTKGSRFVIMLPAVEESEKEAATQAHA